MIKKPVFKQILLWVAVLAMMTTMFGGAYAADTATGMTAAVKVSAPDAIDCNSYTKDLTIDWSQAMQQPLTGYFTKAVGTDRSLKFYISKDAPIRPKVTVIAVPDGVDTYSFLYTEGWITIADELGEMLFVLEPGKNGWGSQAQEQDYVTKAMNFLNTTKNDKNVALFSTWGTHYFVGYKAGCAPLEGWTTDYPFYVNSQAFIGGTSVGQSYLDTTGAKIYDGHNTGGYHPGFDDPEWTKTLKQLGYDGTFITRKDVAVPTWFAGYDKNSYSIAYWKKANDVLSTPDGDTYRQDINSDAWQTQYANDSIVKNNPTAKYGMSQVKVTDSTNLKATDIYGFLSNYIRYTITFAYSNHLEYRLNYGAVTTKLQKIAADGAKLKDTYNYHMPDGKIGTFEFWGQADGKVKSYDNKTGTVIEGVAALSDYNNDGKKDPRNYMVYIPDSAKELWGDKGAPVVIGHPGNAQTVSVFMDASCYWQIANEEGIVIVVVGETYSNAVAVTYKSDKAEFDYMLEDILKYFVNNKYVKLDFSRIYGSGHSAGSSTIQALSITNPDLVAATASTSFAAAPGAGATNEQIPIYLIHGQADLPFLMPDLWGNSGLQDWANYFFKANGLKTDINSCNASNTIGRLRTYVWTNSQGIPLVQYGYTLAREHNCIPQEFRNAWDFLKHYSFTKDSNGHVTARYYSRSGYKLNDAVKIVKDNK